MFTILRLGEMFLWNTAVTQSVNVFVYQAWCWISVDQKSDLELNHSYKNCRAFVNQLVIQRESWAGIFWVACSPDGVCVERSSQNTQWIKESIGETTSRFLLTHNKQIKLNYTTSRERLHRFDGKFKRRVNKATSGDGGNIEYSWSTRR